MSTLLRTLPVSKGHISIDSLSIDQLPLSTLRRRLITIPQDPVLLPGTVRLNLDPFHYQQDVNIISALEKVDLWELLANRGGLDGELDAVSFSKGQQQLFAIVRALLQRQAQGSTVVLLDEAMSSVDANTEKVMDKILRAEFSMCTVVCIAHRVETILSADVVAVMEHGKVVELGNPKELMEKDGKLKSLVGGTGEVLI
jgi:ATP-binding cassette subfamily C (CFTR/MRP) protein 1